MIVVRINDLNTQKKVRHCETETLDEDTSKQMERLLDVDYRKEEDEDNRRIKTI